MCSDRSETVGAPQRSHSRHGRLHNGQNAIRRWNSPNPSNAGPGGPKGGVGSPTGFARGAGRELALPVWEAKQHTPQTTSVPEEEEVNNGIWKGSRRRAHDRNA